MQQSSTTPASSSVDHADENDILADMELLLDGDGEPRTFPTPAPAAPSSRRLLAPLFVLFCLGVAIAFTGGGKEALLTGRSVAQAVLR